jgi:ADP-heptose:LPS heptosyltransferase
VKADRALRWSERRSLLGSGLSGRRREAERRTAPRVLQPPRETAHGASLAGDAGIVRVLVFRALVLGDMLCAVPALRALRTGLPKAEISLVGLPGMRELAGRLDCVDRFIDFPGWPGLPERPCDVRALPGFLAELQAQRFDLALQLHGSGAVVNPLVASFGARITAGFHDDASWRPAEHADHFVRWPEHGHEIDRLLTLTTTLGLPAQGRATQFPLCEADRRELTRIWPGWRTERYACVHAGAQLPSRRWGVERFAAVADALAEQGLQVVLTGSEAERELVGAVARSMRHRVVDLAGRTSLWTLGALIEGAERLVCNDTGPSHIAAALGTPSVVVSCGADVARWAPLEHALHPVLWQPMACRPCAHAVCPHGHGCAEAIGSEQVLQALAQLPVPGVLRTG